MKALKTIAALFFLAAVGITLVQPVLDADEDEEPAATGEASPGSGEEPPEPQGDAEVALTARYPKRCMRAAGVVTHGYVAARRGARVSIGPPGGRAVATAEVEGDAAWSASGRFLAEKGGRVVDERGDPQGSLFYRPVEWQWSPVADCALAITERGNLTYSIPGTERRGVRLVGAPVTQFDVSPNGRRLALVVRDQGMWIADLRERAVVQVTQARPVLLGWFSNGKVVYSRYRSDGRLRFATGSGDRGVVRNGSASGTLLRCGGRTLLVGSPRDSEPSLSELVAGRGGMRRRVLTEGYGFWGASCSPDGELVAASRARRSAERGPLVLLRSSGGAPLQELVNGRTANPTWTSDGIVFVKFGKAGRARLWYIGPGAPAALRTGYEVGAPTQYDWHAS